MDVFELTQLAKSYNELGGAVQDQLMDIIDDSDRLPESNPVAVRQIVRWLMSAQDQGVDVTWVLESCEEWLAAVNS